MGTKYNPKIVTDGLVLYVDAANYRSYPGTGLTVSGLVNSVGGMLVGGVGFSSDYLGYFTFDGSTGYINFGNSSTVRVLNGTISSWVKTSSPGSNYRGILAKQYAYGLFYNNSILVAYDWNTNLARSTGINIADNSWKNVVMSFESGVNNGTKIYLNGVNVLTTTITWVNDNQALYGGSEVNGSQYSNCSSSIFSLYNRALSDLEILQNYNVTKKRFGH
jgi:hypothetical protein